MAAYRNSSPGCVCVSTTVCLGLPFFFCFISLFSTVVCVAGDDFAIGVGDTRLSVGYSIHSRMQSKITKLCVPTSSSALLTFDLGIRWPVTRLHASAVCAFLCSCWFMTLFVPVALGELRREAALYLLAEHLGAASPLPGCKRTSRRCTNG